MASRGTRTARALASALLATFVAAAFHTLGGGDAPGPVTLLLASATATLACLVLVRARLSLPRLLLSIVVSQAAFHLFFEITSGSSALAGHSHGAGSPAHAVIAVHQSAPMGLSHLAAVAVTALLLLVGERAALTTLGALRRLLWRASAMGDLGAVHLGHPRPSAVTAARRARIIRAVASSPVLRRGPPSLV